MYWRAQQYIQTSSNPTLGEAGYRHEVVNHSEWVRGECHINGFENRASLLRPWLAVHRGICRDNLSLYLASFKAYRKSEA
jgi:transposase-like protein